MDALEKNEFQVWSQSPLLALAALWATLLFLVSLIEYPVYLHEPAVPLWKPLTLAGLPTFAWSMWLLADLRSARYRRTPLEPARSWFLHQLLRLPAMLVGYVLLVGGVRYGLFLRGDDPDPLVAPMRIPFEILKSALFYCVWLGLLYGTLSLMSLREKSAQLIRVQKALTESQLAQLQAQLRPHFLFNTLNTVSSLMQTDVRRADRVLTQLGDLLRASLGADNTHRVPLSNELDLLRMYSSIMVERFSDRVSVEWHIAEDALCVAMPALLLQPLLENAFKYGIERTMGRELIRVSASCEESHLRIQIFNSGSMLPVGWVAGVGITNCRERLQILYGGAATLALTNARPSGVEVSITVPSNPGPA